MIDAENKKVTITADNGETQTFDILFTFEDPESDYEYVVFTDYTPDDKGGTSLSAARYHRQDPEQKFEPIEKDEWDIIYKVLEDLQNSLEQVQETAV